MLNPIAVLKLTTPAKRKVRAKYGHAACNTDLCTEILPPLQMIAKSVVASLGVTSNSFVEDFLLGLSGCNSSELEACGFGVCGSDAKLSSLGFMVTNWGAAIIVGGWHSIACIYAVGLTVSLIKNEGYRNSVAQFKFIGVALRRHVSVKVCSRMPRS